MPTHFTGSRSPWMHWWGPVLLYLGPCQWVPPDLHGSPGPAQNSVHDTFRLVRIHKDADGPGVNPCHLPTSDAGNHVILCLPLSACLPRWPPSLPQDVRRTHEHLERLLQRVTETGLKLKASKCQFLRREVTYLGHTISADGVSCESGKVECVQIWPTPTTTTELLSFPGLASYYWRFISGFARTAGPLHDLVSEEAKHSKKKAADVYISNVFTYRVCYHVWPWLSEFSGVVLNCFTLSNSTIFTDGSLINPEDNLYSLAWVRKLVNGMDGPFLIIFIR